MLSHELETVLDNVRSDKIILDAQLIDTSLECIKRIGIITDEVAHRGPIKTKINDLILALTSDDPNVKLETENKNEIEKIRPPKKKKKKKKEKISPPKKKKKKKKK